MIWAFDFMSFLLKPERQIRQTQDFIEPLPNARLYAGGAPYIPPFRRQFHERFNPDVGFGRNLVLPARRPVRLNDAEMLRQDEQFARMIQDGLFEVEEEDDD